MIDKDDLQEIIDDAACNGEGRVYAEDLIKRLEDNGLKIVSSRHIDSLRIKAGEAIDIELQALVADGSRDMLEAAADPTKRDFDPTFGGGLRPK